jgi:glycosyltransferase involved in cell wall biosynthesis
MKVAFFSALPFGVIGSPGTYKFIEKCRDYLDLLVFAPPGGEKTVFENPAIPIIPVRSIVSDACSYDVIQCLRHFNPNIIYIFNFPLWHKLLLSLKKQFPLQKYILDIKSPLLADGQKREDIRKNGEPAHIHLDAIFTLSEKNVPTWIPNCSIKPHVYPLGIDLDLFDPQSGGRSRCRKFVYIGVLHQKRRLDLLIQIFYQFIQTIHENVQLDIYGTGPDQDRLHELISGLSIEENIQLCGLVSQKKLMKKLSGYDAGIAWVPHETYDASPSLKAVEYMAAGIPILASDTKAHRLLENAGCTINFFRNTSSSFCQALQHVLEKGFSQKRVQQNLEVVAQFDFHAIIQAFFCPVFKRLAKTTSRVNETKPSNGKTGSKSGRLLFIGPLGFKPGIWETRAHYILPDLFDAVPDTFKIHFLTAPVPEFAKKDLDTLCRRYDMCHFEAHPRPRNMSSNEYWRIEILSAAYQVRPDVITNVFGPVTLGAPMGIAGKNIGARIILRVAGDEIESRISLGTYNNNLDRLDMDLVYQAMGSQWADTIIAMSPLEKERICQDLPESQWDKVVVCIRGIDVARFAMTKKNYPVEPVEKFLYVGRKSLEKGFDIAEEAAGKVFAENKKINFVFAGSFEQLKHENRNYIGWVDSNDLQTVFSGSDAYIMTSRSEGFPQTVAEAMAAGLPCILPRHIFKDLLEDRKHALLCDLNPENIKNLVLQLHEDRHLAAALSREVRKFAETRLDKKVWSKIYRDILSGNETAIDNLFSVSQVMKRQPDDRNSQLSLDNVLKMVVVVDTTFLSFGKARHRLNRFMIEMVRRNHLIYLVFPEGAPVWFLTCEKVIYMPFRSQEMIRQKINDLAPDLLVAGARPKQRNSLVSVLCGLGKPMVLLEWIPPGIRGNKKNLPLTLESAAAVCEEEVILSFAAVILSSGDDFHNRFPGFIHQQVVCFPKIVFSKTDPENMIDIELKFSKKLPSILPIEEMTCKHWEKMNKKVYDFIEAFLLKIVRSENISQHVFLEQYQRHAEKALHVRRMGPKVIHATQKSAYMDWVNG